MTKKKKIIILVSALLLLVFLWFLYWYFFTDHQEQKEGTNTVTPTPQAITPTEAKGRGDPNLYEKLQIETQNNYPLLNLTPHRENTWTLDYIGPLRFEVTIKGTITEAIKTEVFDWIKEQGLDPNSHQFDWKTSR